MTVNIPVSTACGTVTAPPSKSMSHRLLISAFLAGGGTVSNISMSEDIKATLNCIRALGGSITGDDNGITVSGALTPPKTELFCNESGSTLRFFIPIALMAGGKATLTGTKRLLSRSLDVYRDICKEQGILFEKKEDSVTVCGRLRGGKYRVRADISSQFISGLMFALPLADTDSEIELVGKIESLPYLTLTQSALQSFGVKTEINKNVIYIKGNQKYTPANVTVEGDWSNAAFFEAFNYIGSDVRVLGVSDSSGQGDKVCIDYFRALKDGSPTLDVSDCPDLAPILMSVAALNNGAVLKGTARLKIKESDRGLAMKQELEKLGVSVTVLENEITVTGGVRKPTETVNGHNDHRIVMAMAVALTKVGGTIEGAEAVSKSYPDFFDRLSEVL